MYKARINTGAGIKDLLLLAQDFDDARREVQDLIENGTINGETEEVLCIINA